MYNSAYIYWKTTEYSNNRKKSILISLMQITKYS